MSILTRTIKNFSMAGIIAIWSKGWLSEGKVQFSAMHHSGTHSSREWFLPREFLALCSPVWVQGYLAHKKPPTPKDHNRALGIALL